MVACATLHMNASSLALPAAQILLLPDVSKNILDLCADWSPHNYPDKYHATRADCEQTIRI